MALTSTGGGSGAIGAGAVAACGAGQNGAALAAVDALVMLGHCD